MKSQSGQSAVDYLLICALTAIILFTGNPSPVERLLAALQENYQKYSFTISQP